MVFRLTFAIPVRARLPLPHTLLCIFVSCYQPCLGQETPRSIAAVIATSNTSFAVVDRGEGLLEFDLTKRAQTVLIPFNDPGIRSLPSLNSDKSRILMPAVNVHSPARLLNLKDRSIELAGSKGDTNAFWISDSAFITSGLTLSNEKPIDDTESSGPLRLTVWSLQGTRPPVQEESLSVGGDWIDTGGQLADGTTFLRSVCGTAPNYRADFVTIDTKTGKVLQRRPFPTGHLNVRYREGRKEWLVLRPRDSPEGTVAPDSSLPVYGYTALQGTSLQAIHPQQDIIAACTVDRCPQIFRVGFARFSDKEWTFLPPFDKDPEIPVGLRTKDRQGLKNFFAKHTIAGLDFSPDGSVLIASTVAGRLCAWETSSWTLIYDSAKESSEPNLK
jgi:hypothetical protein